MKIVEIDDCTDCPFFDNDYWEYNHECTKLNRRIEIDFPVKENKPMYQIPVDCPLPEKT